MSGLSRSMAFTALLELDPDGFGKQDMRQSGETITDFLEEFDASKQGNIWEFAKTWLADQRAAKAAAQRDAEEEREEADRPQLSPHPAPAQNEMDTYTVSNGHLVPAEPDERDLGPSQQQVMDWQIHNDHADGAEYDQGPSISRSPSLVNNASPERPGPFTTENARRRTAMIRIVRSKTLSKMREETATLRQTLVGTQRAASAWYDEADYQRRVAEQAREDPRTVEARVFGQVVARQREEPAKKADREKGE